MIGFATHVGAEGAYRSQYGFIAGFARHMGDDEILQRLLALNLVCAGAVDPDAERGHCPR